MKPVTLQRFLEVSGQIARYPLDPRRDLFGQGVWRLAAIIGSVLWARLVERPDRNAEAYARYWLGHRFLRSSGLRSYLRRFYGVAPESIEAEFARSRMHWIGKNARVRNVIGLLRGRDQSGPPVNRELVRPVEGFNVLYGEIARILRAEGVRIVTSARPERLSPLPEGGFVLRMAGRDLRAQHAVSTIPVNRMLELCGLDPEPALRATSLTSLFYSFAGQRGFGGNVLYNFTNQGMWKRLTVHSDFYGEVGGRIHFSLEAISARELHTPEAVDADFRAHLAAHPSVLLGDLRLEGATTTGNAYPVYVNGATAAAKRATRRLRDFGIPAFGRQGGFDYQPTARVSAEVAEREIRAMGS